MKRRLVHALSLPRLFNRALRHSTQIPVHTGVPDLNTEFLPDITHSKGSQQEKEGYIRENSEVS